MTNKPKPISDTARALLTAAAIRGDYLVRPPKLPIAAARQVVRSLLNAGLVEEVPATIDDAGFVWRTGEDGGLLMLRATAVGIAHVTEVDGDLRSPAPIGSAAETSADWASNKAEGALAKMAQPTGHAHDGQDDPNRGVTAPASTHAAEAAETTSTSPGRAGRIDGLRRAAQALLDAWDDPTNRENANVGALEGPFASLRAALAAPTVTPTDSPHQLKDTKQAQVLAMLRRAGGASGPAIAEATGWAPHTVRGFLAGLAKKGITVEVLERVRQVGPTKTGAKGSYTVYHVACENSR
jgi:hypothetical protein